MRGGDTLKFQISRLNGKNHNIYTTHPSVFFNQRAAAPHQSAGSEVPSDSFPPGEAKGQLRKLVPFNGELYYLKKYPAINTCTTKITGTPMENFGFLVL